MRCTARGVHVHIVAVSGTAMASLAGLLVELGHSVTGSDTAFEPPMGPALARWGVRCVQGFDPAHLEPTPDLVVIGNVCRRDNPEAQAAVERGLPYTHVAGALSRFVLAGTHPLVVAGTHGKTTTSSLCAWLLDYAGLKPGFLIGGIPRDFERGFRNPDRARKRLPLANAETPQETPPAFVIEGDEYDTAYFEKTPKFIHYGPQVAILTSIEHDHIDIYPTEESYLDAFRRFIALVPAGGLIVANAADARVVELVKAHARSRVSYYALEGQNAHASPHWYAAAGATSSQGTAFELFAGGVLAGRYSCPLPGRHNLSNALAAIAAGAEGYGAPLIKLGQALARFGGVERRQQLLGNPRGAHLYDDFAHHPTAVQETLGALRLKHPGARLLAVFEPRSATACRNLHQRQYARSFHHADEILFAPLGRMLPAGESLDLERLTRELREQGKQATAFDSPAAILSHLTRTVGEGDVVVLMSNGAMGGLRESLASALQRDGEA